MGTFWFDLRHAVRTLRKSPGFALAVVVSLGLGIGANTAIFRLLDALMLQPIGAHEPQQLVRIGSVDSQGFVGPVPGEMLDWLRKEPMLEGVCGVNEPLSTVEIKGELLAVPAHALSGDCYETLGVRPALGRLFTREDDIASGPRVVDLSYNFWQNRFGGDPHVIGQTIRVEGAPFTVIGVTEPAFQGFLLAFPPMVSFPLRQEVNPMGNDPADKANIYWGSAFARLKPGVTEEELRARLSVEWRGLLAQTLPPTVNAERRTRILSEPVGVTSGEMGLDYWARNRFERPLLALLAISGLVLLVSCFNVANLQLARGIQRQREMAVRLALGARRWQLVRELLAESAILIAAALIFALLLARVGDRMLLAVLSGGYSGFALEAKTDLRVWIFTAATAFAVLLFFAVLPARQASAANLTDALKNGSRSATGSQNRTRRILVCAQVAFTLVLLLGAGVFSELLRQLREAPLGFQVDHELSAQLMPLPAGYGHGFNPGVYYRGLLERVKNLPGVEAASLSNFAPLFSRAYDEEIRSTRTPDASGFRAPAQQVSDGFLRTMRIPFLEGRDFGRTDAPNSQKTAIVSESLAKQLFPGRAALGEHIRVGSGNDTQDVEIVGVAADARLTDPRKRDLDFVYLNYWQYPDDELWGGLQLRYSGNAVPVIAALRQTLQEQGHEYPLRLRTISEDRDISLLQERLLAGLGTAFGALALVLAGVGLFGLLNFFVASRTSEFGIRVALGAARRDVIWLMLRETMLLVGAGVLIGLPLSYASERLLAAVLRGASPVPWIPAAAAVALLLGMAGIAAVIPVRRATAVDPLVALRYEG